MKNFRWVPILLCVSVLCSLPSYAVNGSNSTIDNFYTRYTINFDSDNKVTNNTTIKTKSMAADRIQQAHDYVLSLNLDDAGYYYIEDSCLKQLEQMQEDGVFLTSYSVLVPNSTTGVLNYYGTYNGRTYYSQYYSSYSKEISLTSDTKEEIGEPWVSWMENGAEMLLSIGLSAGGEVTLPVAYDLFSAITGIDSPYEVHDEAYFEGVTTLEGSCRGIYTYDDKMRFGTDKDKLILMMSDETGNVRCYLEFHPVDTSYPQASYTFYNSPIEFVNTYQFGNTEGNMSACNVFYNRGEGPIRYSLLPLAFHLTWDLV